MANNTYIDEIITHKQAFYKTKFNGDINNIEADIQRILDTDREGRKVSNIGGYQSNYISCGFDELQYFQWNCIQQIFPQYNIMQKPDFWLNVNKGKDYNVTHIHGEENISCVYYHKLCCDKSPIVFTHLVPAIDTTSYEYTPETQDILIFKGNTPHHVRQCGQENHIRISLAFNYRILP